MMIDEEKVSVNTRLSAQHLKMLREESGISDEIIQERGYRTATTKNEIKELGFSDAQCRVPALVCPVHSVTGEIALYQIRPDNPRAGKDAKAIKYETPSGARITLDIHPSARQFIGTPTRPLFITEGIRKADSAVSQGLCCIALLGVWNFRGANDEGGKTILAAWEYIHLQSREVFIVFDSDVMLKPAVHSALARLKAFLESRSALVKVIYLEPRTDGGKVGLDDFFAAGGVVTTLLAKATNELKPGPDPESEFPYRETHNGLFWLKPTRHGKVETPLCNFTTRIVKDCTEDDGVETRRSFVLDVTQGSRCATLAITAEKFFSMSWPVEALGSHAILAPGPGVKDHTRAAIQLFSRDVKETRVFTHLGWRNIDDRWVYLHAGGAIGAAGTISDIAVSVPSALERFVLPEPLSGDELIDGIDKSLRVLTVAPDEITFPAYAALWRAILGDSDFSMHLTGQSGAGKTEIVTLLQKHHGRDFDARHLPGSWTSTGNSLEALAFTAKDCLLTVDDFCPTGSTADIQRFHREADRILRAQGNAAGRLRMRSDTTLRPAKPPRGLIFSTGEDTPRGQSLRARMLILEVEKKETDWHAITCCQEESSAYAGVLAAFIQWLAPRLGEVKASLKAERERLRLHASRDSQHKRTADIVANLAVGLNWFLTFARDANAITDNLQESIWTQAWEAFLNASAQQDAQQAASNPVARFKDLCAAALASGRAHLANIHGGNPVEAEAWGWRLEKDAWQPRGEKIGWIEEEDFYIEPEAAYAVAQRLARDQGDGLPVTQYTLRKRLKEAGFLFTSQDSTRETLLVRRTIEGQRRAVLHMRRSFFSDALYPPKNPDQPDHYANGEATL